MFEDLEGFLGSIWITPFFGLHPVFNVDHLRPYFPPLLDASDIAK